MDGETTAAGATDNARDGGSCSNSRLILKKVERGLSAGEWSRLVFEVAPSVWAVRFRPDHASAFVHLVGQGVRKSC